MAIQVENWGTMITDSHIGLYRMAGLISCLKLEIKGLKMSKGQSAYSVIKKQYSLKGNKQSVLDQFVKIYEKRKEETKI